jgi:magnesium-transporting ATPase (P-type)
MRKNQMRRGKNRLAQLRHRCYLYETAFHALKDAIHIVDTRTQRTVFANKAYHRRQEEKLQNLGESAESDIGTESLDMEKESIELFTDYQLHLERICVKEALDDFFNTMPQIVWFVFISIFFLFLFYFFLIFFVFVFFLLLILSSSFSSSSSAS